MKNKILIPVALVSIFFILISLFCNNKDAYSIYRETLNTKVYLSIVDSISEIEIEFDSVGGSDISSKTIYTGEEIGELPVPTKDDLTFAGWFTDTTYQTEVYESTIFITNTTLYAKWIKTIDNLEYVFLLPGSCTFNGNNNITTSTNDCISTINPTGNAINYTASSNKYIDTGVPLYSHANIEKDYEVGFTIDSYDPSVSLNRATLMNAKQEDENAKWPGVVFRRNESTNNFVLEARNAATTKEQYIVPSNTVTSVVVYRIEGTIFYSINGGVKTPLVTPTYNPEFDTTTWFGAAPVDITETTAQRHFRGTLSNMYVKIESDSLEKSVVTFVTHGGEADYVEKEVRNGMAIGELPSATKPGYDFDGWYTAENGGTKVTTNTVVNADVTYHAHWSISYCENCTINYSLSSDNFSTWIKSNVPEYTVDYNTNTKISTVSVTGYSGYWETFSIGLSTVAGKEYTFTFDYHNPYGFSEYSTYGGIGVQALKSSPANSANTGSNEITRINLPGTATNEMEKKTLTFTAATSTTYIVFNFGMAADGRTTTVLLGNFNLVETVSHGDTLGNTVTPLSKTGYTFDGWFTQQNGGTQITSSTEVPYQDTTYYAHWSKTATYLNRTLSSESYIYDGTAKIPTVTVLDEKTTLVENTDYTIEFANNVNVGTATATITLLDGYKESTQTTYISSTTTATYYINNAKLTFNKGTCTSINGSSTLYTKKNATVVYTGIRNTTEGIIPTGSKEGYVFTGWYDSSSNGNKVLNNDGTFTGIAVTNYTNETSWQTLEDKTLYARCENLTAYTVTANANGGNISNTTGWTGTGNTATKLVVNDSPYGTLPTVSRNGYTFNGWSLLPNGYTQVEYIQSTGTQYIDTNYQVTKDTGVEATYQFNNTTTQQRVFGVQDTSKMTYEFYINGSARWAYAIKDGGGQWTSTGIVADANKHTLKFNVDKGYYYISNTTMTTGAAFDRTPTVTESNLNLYLFAENDGGNLYRLSTLKIYKFKIYEGSSLVRYMVPAVQDSTGKVGLYDTINDVFYENAATTGNDFTAGNATYITSSDIVNENHTIYAKWAPNTYTLTADANGGTISATTGWTGTGNTATKTVKHDSQYGTLPNVSKEGYVLKNWSLLPEGYTHVEYIQSTGSQWINMNYYLTKDTSIITDFQYTSRSEQARLFGVDTSNGGSSNISYSFYINGSSKWAYSYTNGNGNWISTDIAVDTNRHTLYMNVDNKVKIDNVYDEDISGTITQTATSSMALFALQNGNGISRYASAKIYSFRIYENNELVRDYIPCINDATGKAGLYDLVNNVFYGNSGSGNFTTGEPVYVTNTTSLVKNDNHTIYAIWNPLLTVTADANGGSIPETNGWTGTGNTATKSIPKGSSYGTLPTPTRNGHTFDGWYKDYLTQVEYIESDGSQYIVSNAVASDTMGVYAEISSSDIQGDRIYFGTKQNSSATRYATANMNGKFYYGWNGIYYPSYTLTENEKFTLEFNYMNSRSIIIDDNEIATNLETLVDHTRNMYIFAYNSSGSASYKSKIRIYKFKISDGNQIVHEYVPVINNITGKAGLYDLVEEEFLGEQNGGTFETGSAVKIIPINEITSEDIVDESHTIYAKWTLIDGSEYSITYGLNNGIVSESNPLNYNSESNPITLNNPTKTLTFKGNYNATSGANASSNTNVVIGNDTTQAQTFKGWSGTGLTGDTNTTVTIPTGSTGDRSYTAHWTAVAGTLPTVTRTGYTCGWNTSNSGTTIEYESGGSFPASAITEGMSVTVNLYAVCVPTTYPITYDYNTTNYLVGNNRYINTGYKIDWDRDFKLNSTINVASLGQRYLLFGNYSSSKELNLEVKTDNTLRMYSSNQIGVSSDTISSNTDVAFDFTYIKNSNTLVLTSTGTNSNATVSGIVNITGLAAEPLRIGTDSRTNGTFAEYTLKAASITDYYIEGETISKLPTNPTKPDYTFDGWYTAASGGTEVTSSTSVPTVATTYYAHWIPDSYQITYALNNGINNANNPNSYNIENNGLTLQVPTKTLTFKGNHNATSGANASSSTNVVISSDTTQVQTFKGWSGTGLTGDTNTTVTIPAGSTGDKSYTAHWTAVAGTLPTVTRTGYTCGWSTSNSGTTIEYESGGTYPTSAITEDMSATVNLYAVCIRDSYTITYTMNNGVNNANNPESYYIDSESITLQSPTKVLTFKGNYNTTSGANASSSSGVTLGSDTTQAQTFAGWTGSNGDIAQTNVTIASGSTGDKSYTAHWTAGAGTTPTVTRTGYTCGWSTSSSGKTIEIASGGSFPTSSITEDMSVTVNLYAVCIQNVAAIGNTQYIDIQAAINAVSTNGSTPTTITVLANITGSATGASQVFSVDNNRNVYIDLNGYTIHQNSTSKKTVLINNGTLEVTNGTISSAANQGTIEVSSNKSTFKASNVTITNTNGSKGQGIYNNGGTVYIEAGTTINSRTASSGNNQRAAVHNLNSGKVYIRGGTIISQNYAAVHNANGTLEIGTKDGTVDTTTPIIQGKTYGVLANSTFKFYDGILKGQTGAVGIASNGNAPPGSVSTDTNATKISEIEDNSTKVNGTDGNYSTLYLTQ